MNFNTTVNTGPNSLVQSILRDGSDLYIGGSFTTYRGDSKGYRLAKVNADTGVMDTTFNSLASQGPNSAGTYSLQGMLMLAGEFFISGGIGNYRNDSRGAGILKISTTNGALNTAFNSYTTQFITAPDFNPFSSYLAPDVITRIFNYNGKILAVGLITRWRDSFQNYSFLSVDPATGAISW